MKAKVTDGPAAAWLVDLGQATIDKFNEVSRRVGATVYLFEDES